MGYAQRVRGTDAAPAWLTATEAEAVAATRAGSVACVEACARPPAVPTTESGVERAIDSNTPVGSAATSAGSRAIRIWSNIRDIGFGPAIRNLNAEATANNRQNLVMRQVRRTACVIETAVRVLADADHISGWSLEDHASAFAAANRQIRFARGS